MTIPEIAEIARQIIGDLHQRHVIGEGDVWDHSRPWAKVAAETLETHIQHAFNQGLQVARDELGGLSTALLHEMICDEDGEPV